jgi:hypothetical protein
VILGRHLGDLIEGARNEIRKLHLDDRTQPHHGCTDRCADKSGLGQRGIENSPFAVLL